MFDGGPAFPAFVDGNTRNLTTSVFNEGMSLRDWFAGQALAGVLANPHSANDAREMEKDGDINGRRFRELLVQHCYIVADAMLKARQQGGAS